MPAERHFLGWDRPVLVKVRQYLLPEELPDNLDLSHELVVVPTRQAGRRLREALALYCSDHQAALFPPRIVTPVYFLRSEDDAGDTASQMEVAAIWAHLLPGIEIKEFSALFPATVSRQDFGWAIHISEMIQKLRDDLADGGHRISDIGENRADILEETDRWIDLAALEQAYMSTLEELGLRDPVDMMIRRAGNPELPRNIERIILAGIPDPTPLMVRALENLAERMPIHILIHAPESLSDYFDSWGRPVMEKWADFEIDIPDPESNVILAGSPASQGQSVLRIIAAERERHGPADIAIGVPDPSVIPFLESELKDRGLTPFDPAGKAVRVHPLYQLLQACRHLTSEESFPAFSDFLRNADVLAFMTRELSLPAAELLEEADRFQNQHLPAGMDDIATHLTEDWPRLRRAFDFAWEQARKVRDTTEGIRSLLQTLYQVRTLNPRNREDAEFMAVARLVDRALTEIERPSITSLGITTGNRLDLLLNTLGRQRYYPEPGDALIDLEGWLELSWDDAPLLIVTGMNEGMVPDTRLSDAFLPDTLRRQLGLRHDAERFATDVFLMCGLIESRREEGRACFIAGKVSAGGDPLRPSRLLLRCGESELPERALRLFGEPEEYRASHPATISFPLAPATSRSRTQIERLPVTAFRDYLACPFRFYLKHILGMEGLDDQKTEMDALDFGLLIHDVLHQMARDERMRQCEDEHRLRHFLQARAERWTAERFGQTPPLPVRIQLDSARQRLGAAARLQAALVSEGWEIIRSEMRLSAGFGGLTVSGRIDRIDRHRETGQIRILDYKTADRPTDPESAHLGPPSDECRDYARVFGGNRERRWIDLQLPLYRLLLPDEEAFQGPVRAGYFNLPRAVTETDLTLWDSFDSRMESARICFEGILSDIRNRRFWPPASRVRYDDFAGIFHAPIPDCVEATDLISLAADPSGNDHQGGANR